MGIFIGNREFVFSSPAVHGLDCNELPSGISYVANATNAPNDSNDYFLVQTILSSGGDASYSHLVLYNVRCGMVYQLCISFVQGQTNR